VSRPPAPAVPRGTIVVAEDDPTTRLTLTQMLERSNFRVIAVEDGPTACEAVRREQPDVVLLDWVMPLMDGPDVVDKLKSERETRSIPIVMLTSQVEVDSRITALQAGVQDFLSKPFDPRELIACIEQQLRWRKGLAVDADLGFVVERDALRAASERRYRFLAEAMPHIVWIADPRGEISFVNRAWYGYAGREPDGSLTAAWAAAIHPDDRDSALRAWSQSLSTGKLFEVQCRLRRASDGLYRWHIARALSTRDQSGTIVEWVGSFPDIHDYKIASETRAVLDTMSNIVAIRSDDGFIEYASPYWSLYTGSHVGSSLGFGWRDFVHPDDLETVEENRVELHASDGSARQYEIRIRGQDGQYRWFLSQTKLLPGPADGARRWLDTATHIEDLKRTQTALTNSETRYRALSDSMPQLVWVTGPGTGTEYVNHRWSEYTGLGCDATRTLGSAAIVHADDIASIDALLTAPVGTEFRCEARFRRHDGLYRWHAVRAVSFDDAAGGTSKWIGTATDIEDSKVAAALLATTAAKLEHLAHHDPMTNLPNRTLLVERLSQAIALAKRAKTEVIVLFVDLDRFKVINDTRGHAAGDRVLAVTSARIAEALRAGDTASRVGGDEFVLVCATAEATGEAARLATRLLAAIGEPIDLDGDTVSVGASIGISMYPSDGLDGEELIQKADSAMYSAKGGGRNLFRIYAAETHDSIVAALDFEVELQAAIARHEIVVHYQPVVSLGTGRLIGAEALVRWQHPVRGLLNPAEFLPFAQRHRLNGEIGAVVLDAVCAQIAKLGPGVNAEFHISTNVSVQQLMRPGWAQEVAHTLELHGTDPRRLQVEIGESVVMSEIDSVIAVLNELRALGISLSIDNFGTGLSSLASIKSFPLHTLKIDRSFVQGIVADTGDQAVAKTIITLAHSLGLNVVASGVETAEQIAALREFGSDAFQGYRASPPMAGPDFIDYFTMYGTEILPPGRLTDAEVRSISESI
jgi:diguanylate cyclase (GGDEF)-like protein/PAS domain S-box-containing protein